MPRLPTVPLTGDLLPLLRTAAEADKHAVIGASRVLLRDGKPVGYYGLLPCLFFWSHTGNAARETFEFLTEAEAAAGRKYVAPCAADSPLRFCMEKRGYEPLGNADFFFRQV
jgi:hypothetical protein